MLLKITQVVSLLCQKASNSFPLYLGKTQISSASQESAVVKNLPANAGDVRDMGSIPGLGRSPGKGNDNPLQYSCLGNRMDREAWLVTVHGISKESDTT